MRLKDQRGFTIAELVVSAGLSLSVLAAVYGVFRSQTHTVKVQESRIEAHEYALNAIDVMVREIRNAAYNPLATTNGANCAGSSGSPAAGTPGIFVADATTLGITYDFRGNGGPTSAADGDCGDAEERVEFAFSSTGCPAGFGNVTRKEGSNAAQALTDCNVTSLQFLYYPQQTSGTAPAPFCISGGNPPGCSGSLNLATIQKVTVTMAVQSKSTDVNFSGPTTVTMSLNADLRNRGLPS
jgi:type II secretory pathway pseudopilin PulG